MIAGKTFDEIHEGDHAQFDVVIDDALVQKFADLSGDDNPLHMDAIFANGTPMKNRVAHGMLGGALFSRLIGMHLPGTHALYLSQSLFFKKPMFLATTVCVSGTVLQKIESVRVVKMTMMILDVGTGDVITEGEALVKVLL